MNVLDRVNVSQPGSGNQQTWAATPYRSSPLWLHHNFKMPPKSSTGKPTRRSARVLGRASSPYSNVPPGMALPNASNDFYGVNNTLVPAKGGMPEPVNEDEEDERLRRFLEDEQSAVNNRIREGLESDDEISNGPGGPDDHNAPGNPGNTGNTGNTDRPNKPHKPSHTSSQTRTHVSEAIGSLNLPSPKEPGSPGIFRPGFDDWLIISSDPAPGWNNPPPRSYNHDPRLSNPLPGEENDVMGPLGRVRPAFPPNIQPFQDDLWNLANEKGVRNLYKTGLQNPHNTPYSRRRHPSEPPSSLASKYGMAGGRASSIPLSDTSRSFIQESDIYHGANIHTPRPVVPSATLPPKRPAPKAKSPKLPPGTSAIPTQNTENGLENVNTNDVPRPKPSAEEIQEVEELRNRMRISKRPPKLNDPAPKRYPFTTKADLSQQNNNDVNELRKRMRKSNVGNDHMIGMAPDFVKPVVGEPPEKPTKQPHPHPPPSQPPVVPEPPVRPAGPAVVPAPPVEPAGTAAVPAPPVGPARPAVVPVPPVGPAGPPVVLAPPVGPAGPPVVPAGPSLTQKLLDWWRSACAAVGRGLNLVSEYSLGSLVPVFLILLVSIFLALGGLDKFSVKGVNLDGVRLPALHWPPIGDWTTTVCSVSPDWVCHSIKAFGHTDIKSMFGEIDGTDISISIMWPNNNKDSSKISKIQTQLPSRIYVGVDDNGKLVVPQEFYHALKDHIGVIKFNVTRRDGSESESDYAERLADALTSSLSAPGTTTRLGKGAVKSDSKGHVTGNPSPKGKGTVTGNSKDEAGSDARITDKPDSKENISSGLKSEGNGRAINNSQDKPESIQAGGADLDSADSTSDTIADRADKAWQGWISKNSAAVKKVLGSSTTNGTVVSRDDFTKLIQEEVQSAKADFRSELSAAAAEIKELEKELQKLHNSPPKGMSKSEVKALVNAAVAKAMSDAKLQAAANAGIKAHLADHLTNQVNFFSAGSGAVIDPGYTSPTYKLPRPKYKSKAWFDRDGWKPQPPRIAIEPWTEEAECFCARGNSRGQGKGTANISILISRDIIPEHLVVEHILPGATLDAGAIPKNLEVWATFEEINLRATVNAWSTVQFPGTPKEMVLATDFVKIGHFVYENHNSGDGVQVFKLSSDLANMNAATNHLHVRALDNYGADHTCFYRLRMYGDVREREYP
ncbi:hypothetical protein BJ170DRAFT_730538 [Xylariales sp. AK1849]|nr:hypothetical protein BJ170DRAFT_730538 [Xylariales sp. AK1849]